MKIRLLVSRAGPGGSFAAGDEIEVDAAEAKRMIEAGQAMPVRSATKSTTKKEKAVK